MLSSFIILRQSIALRELETLGKRGLHEGGLDLLAFGGGIDRPGNRHIKRAHGLATKIQMAIPEADTEVSRERRERERERNICIYARALSFTNCASSGRGTPAAATLLSLVVSAAKLQP